MRIGPSVCFPCSSHTCGSFVASANTNLPGYVSFFQFLRNFRYQNAFEQAELILWAALDPTVASRARRGEFVKSLDHFDLLQTAINSANPVAPLPWVALDKHACKALQTREFSPEVSATGKAVITDLSVL